MPRIRRDSAAAPVVAHASRDKGKERSEQSGKSYIAYALIALIVIVLCVGMGKAYMDYQKNKKYSKAFIVALYGIKSGEERSNKLIDGLVTKWQSADASVVAPRVLPKDLEKAKAVKNKIGNALSSLQETPEDFMGSEEKLKKLHGTYVKIYDLSVTPQKSLPDLIKSQQDLEKAFTANAKGLKKAMPKMLIDELLIASAKHRNLEFMIK